MANPLIESRALRVIALGLMALLLAPMFTACGGGEDLEPEEPHVYLPPPVSPAPTPVPPVNCSAIPRPPACI